ncbi:CHAD domain-containing protein [Carboxylicivirga sp. N1Y90]|uniref:CHAD domain-containing protein n=1 Tax=Carboxylicivirga fragile TaxID=3417571 RepID=UPI003D337A32|nr:CHAD domain-containing protein [Marinilabiliaceae bacterium N1Y90]
MYRFAIDNQEELRDGISRVLNEQYSHIEEQIKITDNIDISVHEIRKTLKRVRGVLRLIRYDIGEELYHIENVKCRELARLLSKIRDLHVIISYLAECFEAEEIKVNEGSFIKFIDHLNTQKELALQKIVDNNVFQHISDKASDSKKAIENYPLNNLGPHTIQEGVTKVYQQCLGKMEESQLNLDDHSTHQLRKKVKYLLNQMLLMQEVWPDYFVHYSSSLKTVSDLLGDDHNLAETVAIIQECPDTILIQEEKDKMIKSINNEKSQIHDDVWPLLGKIFTEEPEAFVKRIKSYWLISRE